MRQTHGGKSLLRKDEHMMLNTFVCLYILRRCRSLSSRLFESALWGVSIISFSRFFDSFFWVVHYRVVSPSHLRVVSPRHLSELSIRIVFERSFHVLSELFLVVSLSQLSQSLSRLLESSLQVISELFRVGSPSRLRIIFSSHFFKSSFWVIY